jgi:hypothetical protein
LKAGLDEMRRTIREKEPERPSTRLRQASLAISRSDLITRHSSLATDLDWIVMKCLEKDRTRRYETANGLAAVIYTGTGEDVYSGYPYGAYIPRGAGIFKTGDGGATWTQLASTASSAFQYVSRLAIAPNNSQVMLAATRSGIFRSADGGETWTTRYTVEMVGVAFHPTDSTQCIASGYHGRALYSTNGGLNWPLAAGLPGPSAWAGDGRVELTYCRLTPSIVYASVGNNNGEIYRSSNGGRSYTLRNSAPITWEERAGGPTRSGPTQPIPTS